MVRTAIAVSLALLGGCAFQPGPGLNGGDDDDDDPDAAAIDGDTVETIDAAAFDATAIDARVIDGPPPTTCPIAGYGGGAYRYIAAATTWLAAEQDCEDDLPGHTHLAVIDNLAEGGALIGFLAASGSANDVWVGVVRDPSSTTWRWVTGGTATYLPWGANQPDGGDQYVVRVDKFGGTFYDRGVSDALPALCECDHRPPMNADYDPLTP